MNTINQLLKQASGVLSKYCYLECNKLWTPLFALMLMAAFSSQAQFKSTGLTITITTGTTVKTNGFDSDGRLINNGTLILNNDVIVSDYRGFGSFTLNGFNQNINLSENASIGTLFVNGGGIKQFAKSITITNALTLIIGKVQITDGQVTANAGARIGGGSNTSYVVGKLTQTGNAAMFFPIGSATQYAPITLSGMQTSLVTLGMELFEEDPNGVAGRGTLEISKNRYWLLSDVSGNFEGADVSLPMLSETVVASVNDVVVVSDGGTSSTFNSYGRRFTTGSLNLGTIISDQKLPAGRFTIGKFFDEQLRVADSLALVSLYDDTRGRFWSNSTGWRKTNLETWFGVTVENKRVTAIALPNNNLEGPITESAVFPITNLASFNVASNLVNNIPSFNTFSGLSVINVSDNQLNFSMLQNQSKIGIMSYVPQAILLTDTTLVVDLGRSIALDRRVPGTGNAYVWKKGTADLTGGTRGDLFVQNATPANEGIYSAKVTNPSVPGLTLEMRPIELFVSSLDRDIAALLEMYQKNGGDNWQNPNGAPITGWKAGVDISEWSLVKLNTSGFRVEEVNLNSVGVKGELPGAVGAMTFVKSFDLANNDITTIPSMKKILNLGKLDVSNNRLGFASIQNNLGIPNFTFSPQKPLTPRVNIKVPQGTPYEINLPILGQDLTYVWRFNGNVLQGETTSRFGIDSVNFENMGIYQLEVRDKLVAAVDPNFRLLSGEQNLQATASLSGSIFNADDAAVNNSEVTLYAIRPSGQPYDSIGTFSTTGNSYQINDVVLNDYILLASTGLDLYIPTYHESAVTWSIADPIKIRKTTKDVDVRLLNEPEELVAGPDNDNEVNGFLELDTDDFPEGTFTSGRTLARRRVANAGVSLSRLRATNRGEATYDLISYVLTDEDGFFKTGNLPKGTYRINVEYPGIPMDPTTFVEFELGEDQSLEKNIVSVLAEIKPLGIRVGIFKETGIKRKLLDNLMVFPNPGVDEVTVSYNIINNASMMIQVVDLNGKTQFEHDLQSGSQQLNIDVRQMRNGIYILRFLNKESGVANSESLRLLINR
jgi:hypothetical protein